MNKNRRDNSAGGTQHWPDSVRLHNTSALPHGSREAEAHLAAVVEAGQREIARRTLCGQPVRTRAVRFLSRAFADKAQREDQKGLDALIAARAHELVELAGCGVLPLYARRRFAGGLRALLAAGASVRATDERGIGCLENLLIDGGGTEAVLLRLLDLLIDAGADVRGIRDNDTPLHFAAARHTPSVAVRLLGAGAAVNAVNKGGRSAAFYAVHNRSRDEVLEILTRGGADLNLRDHCGLDLRGYWALFSTDNTV